MAAETFLLEERLGLLSSIFSKRVHSVGGHENLCLPYAQSLQAFAHLAAIVSTARELIDENFPLSSLISAFVFMIARYRSVAR